MLTEARRLDTFLVSYTDRDPVRAQRIADRLVSVFVDENSKARTEHAENTSAFIAEQLRTSQERLGMLESNLRRAKETHMGQLPEQMNANLQTLSGVRGQLESNTIALRSEQDRLTVIERQLDDLRRGSPTAMILGGTDIAIAPESHVLALQRELAAARSTYTDKHPEVQRIQQELDAARQAANGQPTADRLSQLELDPAYRRLMGERETALLRVREAQRAIADARTQIGTYQARVEAAPRVEQQLASVQRDFDLEKGQVLGVVRKAAGVDDD